MKAKVYNLKKETFFFKFYLFMGCVVYIILTQIKYVAQLRASAFSNIFIIIIVIIITVIVSSSWEKTCCCSFLLFTSLYALRKHSSRCVVSCEGIKDKNRKKSCENKKLEWQMKIQIKLLPSTNLPHDCVHECDIFDDIYWIEKWRINFGGRKEEEIYYLHLHLCKNQANNSCRLYEPAASCSHMNLIVSRLNFINKIKIKLKIHKRLKENQ